MSDFVSGRSIVRTRKCDESVSVSYMRFNPERSSDSLHVAAA